MPRRFRFRLDTVAAFASLALCACGSDAPSRVSPGGTPSSAASQDGVLTQHNDSHRTGANLAEQQLTPANVNVQNFGKLFDLAVDGQVYAQPLVVSDVAIGGQRRNLLVVATQHNTLFGFDADTGERLWQRNFGIAARTPNNHWRIFWFDAPYHDLTPEIGITSTPVIDRQQQVIYFTTFTEEAGTDPRWHHWLHAVSLADPSRDLFGGPVEIVGSGVLANASYGVGRHATHATGGVPTAVFTPSQQLQRPALLMTRGRIVLAFGSHADSVPYQGWVFSYDAADLRKTPGAWLSAERELSGIWQSGMGLTTDGEGSVFVSTGNGFFDGKQDFGNSIVQLQLQGDALVLKGYFAPCNQNCLRTADIDLGSSGMLHLPGTSLFLGGGKQGRLYLLDATRMPSVPPPSDSNCDTCQDKVLQRFQASCGQHIHGSPVYWKSARRGAVAYLWAEDDRLRAFPFDAARKRFSAQPCNATGGALSWTVGAKMSPEVNTGMTGGMLSLSADGDTNGIVWAATPYNNDANPRAVHGVIRAYDADDLTRELWNSFQNLARDDSGNYAKFTAPTVVNGKLYVATLSGHVSVYGLNPSASPPPAPELLANGGFEAGGTPAWQGTGVFRIEAQWQFPCQGPYLGSQYGALYPTDEGPAGLEQVIVAPSTGRYVLRAYVATDVSRAFAVKKSSGTQLGVEVGGRAAATADVTPAAGYLPYVLRFAANRGDRVRVWLRAPQMDWTGASFLLKSRGACYPTARFEFNAVQPERSFLANKYSAWAAIDSVSLTVEP